MRLDPVWENGDRTPRWWCLRFQVKTNNGHSLASIQATEFTMTIDIQSAACEIARRLLRSAGISNIDEQSRVFSDLVAMATEYLQCYGTGSLVLAHGQ